MVLGRLVAGERLLVAVELDDDVTVAGRPFQSLVLAAAHEKTGAVFGEGLAIAFDVLLLRLRIADGRVEHPVALGHALAPAGISLSRLQ